MWIIEGLLASQEGLCFKERRTQNFFFNLWRVCGFSVDQTLTRFRCVSASGQLSIKWVYTRIIKFAQNLEGFFAKVWTFTLRYARSQRGIRRSYSFNT
jgi:hypothetical protein